MPSSTFNSERGSSWARVWTLAVVLAVAALASWETVWRMRGVESTVQDDRALWSRTRARLGAGDASPGVVIGSSRAQIDIDPEILARAFDDATPLVLAIRGASPRPVLAHLARESDYRGVVVLEINPLHAFATSPTWDDVADEFIDHYAALPHIGKYEIDLRVAAQQRLVLLTPGLKPHLVLRDWITGGAPASARLTVRDDRHLSLSYTPDASAARRSQEEYYRTMGTSESVELSVAKVVRESRTLRSRGGEVVLLRLPSSGEVRRIEHERFPRERFWDVLVARSGLTAIHFDDYPELRGFDCPDGSHLSSVDAKAFTRRLVPILERTFSHRSPAGGS